MRFEHELLGNNITYLPLQKAAKLLILLLNQLILLNRTRKIVPCGVFSMICPWNHGFSS